MCVRCKKCGQSIDSSIEAVESHELVCDLNFRDSSAQTASIHSNTSSKLKPKLEENRHLYFDIENKRTSLREIHVIMPEVYHNIRSLFGISTHSFVKSLGLNGIVESLMQGHFSKIGARCSPFQDFWHIFASADEKFYCQLITDQQHNELQKFIEHYYNYVNRNRKTKLFRIVGHFQVAACASPLQYKKSGNHVEKKFTKQFNFVVLQCPINQNTQMSNGLPKEIQLNEYAYELHRRYEISGTLECSFAQRFRGATKLSQILRTKDIINASQTVGDVYDFISEEESNCVLNLSL